LIVWFVAFAALVVGLLPLLMRVIQVLLSLSRN
jgi:hypothetical protein